MSANPLIDSTPHFRNDASTVIVFGENLVDLLVDGNGSVEATHGGGPTNVARTIARLGQRVALITGLSSDAFGQGIGRRLIDDRVDLDFAVRTSSPTTLAVVEKAAEPPNYVFHISGTAAFLLEREHALDAYRSLASSLGALYVGSLGIVVEPMASALDIVIDEAEKDLLVMLDPNCRPALVPDVDAYRRRLDHYFARADVVKVSADDLRFLYPGATSDEGARSILETGGQLVIVTDGPHPVTLHQSCGTLSVPVPQVEVVTTVGAGDAFVGGFLAWFMAGGLGRHSLVDIDLVATATTYASRIAADHCRGLI